MPDISKHNETVKEVTNDNETTKGFRNMISPSSTQIGTRTPSKNPEIVIVDLSNFNLPDLII